MIGLVSFLLAGCAESTSNDEKEANSSEPEVVQDKTATPAVEESTAAGLEVDNEAPAQPASVSAGPAKLNPPHGQPGHDCDIAVGAPLDGSGGQVQPAAQPTFNPQVAQGSAPANGINPPHGQPGHDCDVAVGAPLPTK